MMTNSSTENDVTILDVADSRISSATKIIFSYAATENEYDLTTERWMGLQENPGFIILKPLENRKYVYKSVVRYPERKDYKFMKFEYRIVYSVINHDAIEYKTDKGEQIFKIN
ncbi:hypothetical protein [Bacteroides sp. 51]|uniref:hypothetical protein n=1 Tax=Bacteroides sp. 51 TaxID=2302938 RepID=UPI0013CF7899|nr:hypothetical protein [Bacteroides sp. 51]